MIIRGLRAVSDFEYEFQMVAMNQRLNPEIETVFLMADPRHQAIASRLVKEIANAGRRCQRRSPRPPSPRSLFNAATKNKERLMRRSGKYIVLELKSGSGEDRAASRSRTQPCRAHQGTGRPGLL